MASRNWEQIDAVILDRKLPDGKAEELLPRIKQLAPRAAVIIVTGYSDLEDAPLRRFAALLDYILKPVNMELLQSRLAGIAQRKHAEETIAHLSQDIQRRVTDLRTLLDVVPIGIAIAEDAQCRWIPRQRGLCKTAATPRGIGLIS